VYAILVGRPLEKCHLGRQRGNGRIKLRWLLRGELQGWKVDGTGLGSGQMVGSVFAMLKLQVLLPQSQLTGLL